MRFNCLRLCFFCVCVCACLYSYLFVCTCLCVFFSVSRSHMSRASRLFFQLFWWPHIRVGFRLVSMCLWHWHWLTTLVSLLDCIDSNSDTTIHCLWVRETHTHTHLFSLTHTHFHAFGHDTQAIQRRNHSFLWCARRKRNSENISVSVSLFVLSYQLWQLFVLRYRRKVHIFPS